MDANDLVGQSLGQTQLRELIGLGGMGAVYLGFQESLERRVAVKVMQPNLTQTNFTRRFELEAKTAAALQHPHIIQIYEYGIDLGISYIVMPYLSGGTLSQRLRQRSDALPSLGEIAELLTQIASALDYAHSQNVIHRDIKPSNIMFDNHGAAYLVDFGIAKLTESSAELTGSIGGLGTFDYMPPEQIKGQPLTGAVDQYALGIVIYTMVAGRKPFEGTTLYELQHKHLHDRPTPPTVFRTNVPDAVTTVLETALAKEPGQRFNTVTAFAQAFKRAIAGYEGDPTGFFTFKIKEERPQAARLSRTPSHKSAPSPRPSNLKPATQPVSAQKRSPLVWFIGFTVLALAVLMGALLLQNGGTTDPAVAMLTASPPGTVVLFETFTPTAGLTDVAAVAVMSTDTATPEASATSTATATETSAPSFTSTNTATATVTNTAAPSLTSTNTMPPPSTATRTYTPTSTTTHTFTPTSTATHTFTPAQTPTPSVGTGTGLLGEYFDNEDLTDLRFSRIDKHVGFNWGFRSPNHNNTTLRVNAFSVRWTGQIEPQYSEEHTFYVYADDGVRLWINNQQIIDRWNTSRAAEEVSGSIRLTAGRRYDIRLEYADYSGDAGIVLSWSSPSQSKQIIPTSQLYPADPPPLPSSTPTPTATRTPTPRPPTSTRSPTPRVGTGTGLLGEYFDNANFTDLRFTRVDPSIRFNWGVRSLSHNNTTLDVDTFSVRWTGQIEPQFSEDYTFYVYADDGVRLWINNQQIIDRWNGSRDAEEVSRSIRLAAGQRYYIRLEYVDYSGEAEIVLAWSSPSLPMTAIPSSQLYPAELSIGTITSNQRVNLRSGPGQNYEVVTSLSSGRRVTIIGFNQDGTWYNIRVEGNTVGWVAAALVRLE